VLEKCQNHLLSKDSNIELFPIDIEDYLQPNGLQWSVYMLEEEQSTKIRNPLEQPLQLQLHQSRLLLFHVWSLDLLLPIQNSNLIDFELDFFLSMKNYNNVVLF
jgi:hypothetical protein